MRASAITNRDGHNPIHSSYSYLSPPLHGYGWGPVNSKSFVSKVLLRIKWKFELQH